MDVIFEGYDPLLKCVYNVLPIGEYENLTNKKLCALYITFFSLIP